MTVDIVREFCLALPEATEKLQWGDELCFKIRGKIFAMAGLDNPRLCFKCTPETFAELIEREDIRPSPYVGRYKWVMLDRLDAVAFSELEDLIRQSYEMVAAKTSKAGGRRPKVKKESRANVAKKHSVKQGLTRHRPTTRQSKTGSSRKASQ